MCEAETFCVLDDHRRRLGDVDTDFDDRRRDEDDEFAVLEILHRFCFFVGFDSAVQKSYLASEFRIESNDILIDLLCITYFIELITFFNQWRNNKHLLLLGDFIQQPRFEFEKFAVIDYLGSNGFPAGGHLVNHAHGKLPEIDQRKRPWDRCRGHLYNMW